MVMDLCLSLLALFFAYLIRFDLKAEETLIREEWAILSRSIGVYIVVKLLVFYAFKIHKGLVRHTSTEDMRRIISANFLNTVIFAILSALRANFLDGFYMMPTSVLLIEFLASTALLLGVRFGIKLIYMESLKQKDVSDRVLIYGAGISGLITKRTMEKDTEESRKLIGFIDDNKKLAGNRLEGVTIFHSDQLERIIKEEGVTLLIIAIQHPDAE